MSRLIDADEVLKSCVDEKGNYLGHDAAVVGEAVSTAPTVDAVPVCRCKDCRYYLNSNEKCGLIDTRLHFYETHNVWTADCFCSWGERKGGDE